MTAAVQRDHIIRQLSIAELSIDGDDLECLTRVKKVVCNFFFPSCGSQSGLHRPVSVCGEECAFVARSCATTWESSQQALRLTASNDPALGDIDCMDTASHLSNLSGCCSGVDVDIPGTWSMALAQPLRLLNLH